MKKYSKKERGLRELYEADPERADALLWGRRSRRDFLTTGAATLFMVLGAPVPFSRNLNAGWVPSALADTSQPFQIPGKDGLIILNDRPLNAETPPHLLDDDFTPNQRFFVRNNGLPPEWSKEQALSTWRLTVDGEVHKALSLSFKDLQQFPKVTHALQLECAGNGRAGYYPPAKGNQWTFGAVGCAKFTGVRLKDVLEHAGLKPSAVFTGCYGYDSHLSGDSDRASISRGTPITKAMEEHTLIAWKMNGENLPLNNGYPVRLVSPGWPGSTSTKWLKRIWIRDRIHDGTKMDKYRVPAYPVEPGTKVAKKDMKIIESLPVKSLITFPKTGGQIALGKHLTLRGHAWAGDRAVKAMHLSYDFGATWIQAKLNPPINRFAWQRWQASLRLPQKGYYEIWARATDDSGVQQPMVVPGWNPSGYINNAMHRIAVTVV